MAKAIIIDKRENKSKIMQLIVETKDDMVADDLEILLNNIEQDFGKPRHIATIGETDIGYKSFKKHNCGPENIFIIRFFGQDIAKQIFNDEIKYFCGES